MRNFLPALFLLGTVGVGPVETRAQDFVDKSCEMRFGSANLRFAHCDGAQRDFGTVIVAIPGWRGTCEETFGVGEGALYSVLNGRRFYDWDCYQYDSEGWKLRDSAAGLADRVRDLKSLGYSDVMFITHSTGGVVALEYLTGQLFEYTDDKYSRRPTPQDQLAGLPDVFESVMWMSPINGLEWYVSFAGLFTFEDQQSLPDLAGGSEYLVQLKERLSAYREWRDSLGDPEQELADTQLLFLQSRIDGVVPYIDPAVDTWLWPRPDAEVQDVPISHTDMSTGRPDLLYLPAYLNDYVAVLRAPLTIRTDEVFSQAAATETSLERQDAVITGISYYAEKNFDKAIVPAVNLMVFMLTETFARSRRVDLQLVDLLLDLFGRELSDPEMAQKAYFPLIQAIKAHDFALTGPRDAAQSPQYVGKILDLIELILASVGDDFRVPVEIDAFLAKLRIASTTRNPDVRDNALASTVTQIATATPEALIGSDVLSRLAIDYYTPRANQLPETTKAAVADAFMAALQRGDEGTVQALNLISSEVTFNGEAQPLWRSLQSPAFTNFLNDFSNETPNMTIDVPSTFEEQLMQLDLEMLLGVGYDGRSTSIAADALGRLNTYTVGQGAISVFTATEPVTTLDNLTQYPGLMEQTRRTLGVTYGPRFEQLYLEGPGSLGFDPNPQQVNQGQGAGF